jgi:hypothetical protein
LHRARLYAVGVEKRPSSEPMQAAEQ